MADWIGTARTNYFEVKDSIAFEQWASNLNVKIINHDSNPLGRGLIANDGYWPSEYWDDEKDEAVEVDFIAELVTHLAPGQVAVLIAAGAEEARYVTGLAIAVNYEGRQVVVTLNDIYRLAEREFGVRPTEAEY